MPVAKNGNGRVEVRKTYKLFINGEFVRSESGRAYRFDGNVNIPRGSRKDLRDAVRAARGAVPGWAARTAMNRGQILYRAAEMLDGRRAQFVDLLGSARAAQKEVDDAVEALVWYAGWTDKAAADNVKRVVKHAPEEMSPYLITAFMEMKTVGHPVGV